MQGCLATQTASGFLGVPIAAAGTCLVGAAKLRREMDKKMRGKKHLGQENPEKVISHVEPKWQSGKVRPAFPAAGCSVAISTTMRCMCAPDPGLELEGTVMVA